MAVKKFEDLIAWQKAQQLCVAIYRKFRDLSDYGFKDQITRASISISNNIAEGFDRKSNADFSRFLYFAIGSSSEVRSMLYLAQKIGYISDEEMANFIGQTEEISKIIRGLIKSLDC